MGYYDPPDDDHPCIDFEKAEVRRARKPHRCVTCSQEIKVGQVYTRIFAVVDGDASGNYKFHGQVNGECLAQEDW
jgi:hypothetical protein